MVWPIDESEVETDIYEALSKGRIEEFFSSDEFVNWSKVCVTNNVQFKI
ncbi:MAG TPA: hypothetical protein VI461_09115 [Chitinophagaceae bacterium]|nr:hypothetical protein [Chitinophagaceae bacterium]